MDLCNGCQLLGKLLDGPGLCVSDTQVLLLQCCAVQKTAVQACWALEQFCWVESDLAIEEALEWQLALQMQDV